ncbi:inositol monophosphatase family protein [Brevibacillus agri]|uniref:inositol monophosphatase family protein n=1 Tax=Brevibacillus agri TaxID=51101 RepID=UPI002867FC3A|nr:inositol monophosphatase family protein [Brevibacillus agri]MED1646595.1 inositol monophosphatase family protein [Brevibacillus agri]MED1657462.1 inositol monophosphatase family protein [Brevibacillus agri]MED1689983.1 inositol monophosphatase family protein [Brevibacillus agri]MED1695386.1 inositol monophosphatase family protein [Brevibacillus agri]MED1700352.1 inositol monophosphatase family protein [Brevibacillus agri]
MQASTLAALKELALQCARSAGELSLKRMKEPFTVEYKTSASDLVTAVDKEVEKHVVNMILQRFPDHGILGEERTFAEDPAKYETLWVIDPIDGTTNFVHQQINFSVSIAIYHKGEGLVGVVYDPSRDELFYAVKGEGAYLNDRPLRLDRAVSLEEALLCTSVFWNKRAEQMGIDLIVKKLAGKVRGMRLLGSAALEMAYVAAGRLDGYVSLSLNAWDFGAGRIIVEEAGGRVTTMTGTPLPYDQKSSVMACNPTFYEELQHYLKSENTDVPS